MRYDSLFCIYLICLWLLPSGWAADRHNRRIVIVNTSRYWFNYRHAANAASVYKAVKQLGVGDEDIVFMSALDVGNEYRNPNSGSIHPAGARSEQLQWDNFELDYRNDEVSAMTFLNVLRGRAAGWSMGKAQLASNANTTILIYMAGHGGDGFFKFHDGEELSAQDLAHAFTEMHAKGMYKEILLILDTCQAATMAHYVTAPNVVVLASSLKGENSYAHQTEDSLGVSVIDRFTHAMSEFVRSRMQLRGGRYTLPASLSLRDLYASFHKHALHSTATVIASQLPGTSLDLSSLKLWRFFGGGPLVADVPSDNTARALDEVDLSLSSLETRTGGVENLLFA
jgi:phosphatidylinositol glycan class K